MGVLTRFWRYPLPGFVLLGAAKRLSQVRVLKRRFHALDFGFAYTQAAGLASPGSDRCACLFGDSACCFVSDSEILGDLEGKFERCGLILVVDRKAQDARANIS